MKRHDCVSEAVAVCISGVGPLRDAENAGVENAARSKLQGVENAGVELISGGRRFERM